METLEHFFSGDLPGKIGLFSDSVDMPNLVMLAAGIEPETSTEADWREAVRLAAGPDRSRLPVTFFKQNYVNALANGDVVASMAWSGDIYQENAIGAPEGLQFATPHDGGLLWTDNMVIPAGALHPVDAITLMDFVYQPAIAALITEFVAYVTPVPEARNQILADADAAAEPAAQEKLRVLADSPLVFLPEEEAAALHTYRELKTDEERSAWNARSAASSPEATRRRPALVNPFTKSRDTPSDLRKQPFGSLTLPRTTAYTARALMTTDQHRDDAWSGLGTGWAIVSILIAGMLVLGGSGSSLICSPGRTTCSWGSGSCWAEPQASTSSTWSTGRKIVTRVEPERELVRRVLPFVPLRRRRRRRAGVRGGWRGRRLVRRDRRSRSSPPTS